MFSDSNEKQIVPVLNTARPNGVSSTEALVMLVSEALGALREA